MASVSPYTSFAYSSLESTGGASLVVGSQFGTPESRQVRKSPRFLSACPPPASPQAPVDLQPGQSITLHIDPLYLSVFDAAAVRWKILPGEHKVTVGPSSATLPLAATVTLEGTK